MFAGGNLGGSVPSYVLVVLGVTGSVVVCSIGDANCCVGSSSLASSDSGHGAASSSSDDFSTGLFLEGRLSLLKSCISVRIIPR